MKSLNNFMFGSRIPKFAQKEQSDDSEFMQHFNTLLENDYLVGLVLSADFKYYTERNLKRVEVAGVELNAKSILNYKNVSLRVFYRTPTVNHSFIRISLR